MCGDVVHLRDDTWAESEREGGGSGGEADLSSMSESDQPAPFCNSFFFFLRGQQGGQVVATTAS